MSKLPVATQIVAAVTFGRAKGEEILAIIRDFLANGGKVFSTRRETFPTVREKKATRRRFFADSPEVFFDRRETFPIDREKKANRRQFFADGRDLFVNRRGVFAAGGACSQ